MNTYRSIILSLIMALTATFINVPAAVAADGGTETVHIKTNAICDACKERIEAVLLETQGVKTADLELETQVVTVTFKPGKVSAGELRQVIAKTGYDADNIKADVENRSNLPMCCTVPGVH